MDREELTKDAYQWIADGACDVYNEPGEAMADFHIAMSAERDAEIADKIDKLIESCAVKRGYLFEFESLADELRGTK